MSRTAKLEPDSIFTACGGTMISYRFSAETRLGQLKLGLFQFFAKLSVQAPFFVF